MFSNTMPNLYTESMEDALRFYRDLLGFAEVFRYPPDGPQEHVELQAGNSLLALSTHAAAREFAPPAESLAGHPFELVVWCDDVDAAVKQLRAAGTPVALAPYDHAAGHRRAYVQDPDGNWLAFVGTG